MSLIQFNFESQIKKYNSSLQLRLKYSAEWLFNRYFLSVPLFDHHLGQMPDWVVVELQLELNPVLLQILHHSLKFALNAISLHLLSPLFGTAMRLLIKNLLIVHTNF